jgi:multiple sugar transport system permease protein
MSSFNLRSWKNTRTIRQQESITAWLLLVPMFLVLTSLLAFPFFKAVQFSFMKKWISFPSKFIGLGNYKTIISHHDFRVALVNTCIFTFSAVFIKLIFGLIMALALNNDLKFRNQLRGFFYLPWVTPGIVSILTWRWMFDSNDGLINYLLRNFHLIENNILWLSSRESALFSVILTNAWIGIPFFGLSMLAALQSIPKEIYDVAAIDGANSYKRFFYITLPWIQNVIIITSVLSTIWTFNDFMAVMAMTGGGPFNSTHVLATFLNGNMGEASAIALISLPLLVLIVVVFIPHAAKEHT